MSEPRLTKGQAAIIGAHTGKLAGDFTDMAKYITRILGRSVWTHELAREDVAKEIEEKSRADFLAICNDPVAEAATATATVTATRELLESLVDSEDCWLDHHGGCQNHGYLSLEPGEVCPQRELKDLLKEGS